MSPRRYSPHEEEQQGGTRVLYPIWPGPQTEFMTSQAEELLYGGAAGGGKSYALRAWAVNYCLTYPGARGVIFRQSFRQLEETHLIEIVNEVPETVAHYAPSKHDLQFPNGSILMFRFCEKDEDARTYDTAEFSFMLFDEITHFSQFTYTYLTSRCRSSKPWWPGPRIRAGGTPLGKGHVWVKARWKPEEQESQQVWQGPVEEGGMTRQFIPARVTDNPAIDKDYLKRLRALPDEEYRAKALGDWDVRTDQFFTRWRLDVHTISPFEIPPDWNRYICHDYGFNAPFATLWLARPPGTKIAYVYREQYGPGVTADRQIAMAVEACDEASEKIRAAVLDPSLYNKVNVKGERIDSIADDWKPHFNTVIRGDNNRVAGWQLVRKLLDWTEGPNGDIIQAPQLHVFTSCSNLIRTLPNLSVDEHNLEDVDSDGEDHAADALRYGVMHMFAGGGQRSRQPGTVAYDKNGRLVVRPAKR